MREFVVESRWRVLLAVAKRLLKKQFSIGRSYVETRVPLLNKTTAASESAKGGRKAIPLSRYVCAKLSLSLLKWCEIASREVRAQISAKVR